jgi:GMP synthase (glutamine-hydrolysing)
MKDISYEDKIVIIDFGSQTTQLIARRIRELGVYCEIISCYKTDNLTNEINLKGIILSGGPLSIIKTSYLGIPKKILNFNKPILGICYGHQLLAKQLGGFVKNYKKSEFGRCKIFSNKTSILTKNFFNKNKKTEVWMNHNDVVIKIPKGFEGIAFSDDYKYTIIQNRRKKIFGVQFHPEVIHTINGNILFKNFLFNICKLKKNWNSENQINYLIKNIKSEVGEENVLCALSGGVDSSVLAALLYKAIGKKLHCFFINTGLLRKNEEREVINVFKKSYKVKLNYVDASSIFLKSLKNITDPETKRKIIGKIFLKIFERESKKFENIKYLAQGTLYPDVIESQSHHGGPSSVIKSHHNVGGLPKKIKFKLVEPFRELFKDEVRKIGITLKLSKEIVFRHPFPGPGLAIRILGKVDKTKIKILQEVDSIFINELKFRNLYKKIWQAFSVLLPIKTVGVMGDSKTYEFVCSLRAVTSQDGMTADFYNFKNKDLAEISNKIINNVKGINRVVYDITSKPPATIEWE